MISGFHRPVKKSGNVFLLYGEWGRPETVDIFENVRHLCVVTRWSEVLATPISKLRADMFLCAT